jgi:hypothetical protein
MNKATISADIVSSSSLTIIQRQELDRELNSLIKILTQEFSEKLFYGRIIKGDYIECVIGKPKLALRIALLIKSYIKSLDFEQNNSTQDFVKFKTYGIRIAVGIGTLNIFDKASGIIDGEAIYLSGRAINEISKLKQTLIFQSKKEKLNDNFSVTFCLLDVLFNKYTKAQSEVMFYLLQNKKEKDIASFLKKSQSAINQHSNSANWYAVESAVKYFEKTVK